MEELVSVVITTYKRDISYVKEALESVINQTYSNIEVYLIDDNGENSKYSKELSALCQEYNNVFYRPNKKNSGAQISRNNGIAYSKGQYVAFLDDDDIWRKDKIEKQMSLFTEDNIGMVFCDGYSFPDGDQSNLSVFREASIYDRPITFSMELFNDFIGSTSQAIIRRSVFDVVGYFDVDMPARQDYEMWLRISKKYKIVGSPERLLYYRVHPGDRISTNWNKCINSYLLLLNKYKIDYDLNRYAKAKLMLRLAMAYKRNKQVFKAIQYTMKAVKNSPSCFFDILRRKIQKKDFVEFYEKKL